MQVRNKYTGELFVELEETAENQIESIIKSSTEALQKIKSMPVYRRHDSLYEVSKRIEKDSEELAKIITIESGKPIKYSKKEVKRASHTMLFSAEESERIYGETIPLDVDPRGINRLSYYVRVPIGTVFSITPFNDPLNLVAHKAGPALAAGNSIINKPSSLTPYSALKLNEFINDSGFPENSLQTVIAPGGGNSVNRILSSDSIKMVTFTGGTDAASELIKHAGMKKYSMELGSNSPVIIWDDADLDSAAESVVDAAFESQGQNCLHAQRILIKKEVYDYFRNRVISLTGKLKIGDPLDADTDIGPMISEGEAQRVESWVNSALKEGADLLAGGIRNGSVLTPTVLSNVDLQSDIWKKEVFGPVTTLRPVESFEEAISLANDVPYGLQAGIFTSNLDMALTAIDRLEYGAVLINDTSDFRIDTMPFGGMKKSGVGREGIRFSIDEMTEIKLAIIKR